jgi:uncharacterized protein YjiS (DUF1127 family)
MPDDGLNICVREPQRPTSQPWIARRKRIVRRANRERHQAIRTMVWAVFTGLARAARRWNERRHARATLRSMTDYELRDLGVSRTAIEAALRRYEGNPDDYSDRDKHPTDI